MQKIECKCGKLLSFGYSPNNMESLLISDVKLDSFQEEEKISVYYNEMDSILKCDNCNRLWIFWNGYKQFPPTCYKLEDENSNFK
jgi:hypothetical protein